MTDLELKNIDEYSIFLTETLTPWSTEQRVAFAAGIAESWLPAYESFAEEQGWGPAICTDECSTSPEQGHAKVGLLPSQQLIQKCLGVLQIRRQSGCTISYRSVADRLGARCGKDTRKLPT